MNNAFRIFSLQAINLDYYDIARAIIDCLSMKIAFGITFNGIELRLLSYYEGTD